MENYAQSAIQATLEGELAYCKFLSANDTGLTGTHQSGIYISKPSIPILFDEPGIKGENKEKWVKIKWQNDIVTDTRFIYYGKSSRNEYRITNFGRGFPFLRPEFTGALFVLVQDTTEDYQGFILNFEDEINLYLDTFNISPTETNNLVFKYHISPKAKEKAEIDQFISKLTVEFPSSEEMSSAARNIQDKVFNHAEYMLTNPDKKLVDWTDMEFKLFRAIEHDRYGNIVANGFSNVDDFIAMANRVLNRRKSRAGKSLEHHLTAIFDANQLKYKSQAITEGRKKPDFIFPSEEAYHDLSFPTENLIFLAAKTTCKDRWRQILNEADRLKQKRKFLCTMQQGVSDKQMDEMKAEQVTLVVPQQYISTYPKDRQNRIWTIRKFIDYVKEVENRPI